MHRQQTAKNMFRKLVNFTTFKKLVLIIRKPWRKHVREKEMYWKKRQLRFWRQQQEINTGKTKSFQNRLTNVTEKKNTNGQSGYNGGLS